MSRGIQRKNILQKWSCDLCGINNDMVVPLGLHEHHLCNECIDLWCKFIPRWKRQQGYTFKQIHEGKEGNKRWEKVFAEFLVYGKAERVQFT